MTSERAASAAARMESARRRAEQLHDRLERLSAGIAPTQSDVVAARACAEDQRQQAKWAQERLADSHLVALDLRRRLAELSGRTDLGLAAPATAVDAVHDAAAPEVATDAAGRPATPTGTNLERRCALLHSALVAVVSPGGGGDDDQVEVGEARQVWQAVVDRCGRPGWKDWSSALCQVAVAIWPTLRGVAVSGYDQHLIPYLLGVSDDWTRRAEEIHGVVGEGPAVEAYTSECSVVVSDVWAEHRRWPGYIVAAAGTDLAAVWALPVKVSRVTVGSLSLYWEPGAGGRGEDVVYGSVIAATAARALQADLDASVDGLLGSDPNDDRIAIATGMVAEQCEVSIDEALTRLRAYAFGTSQGLTQVADDVVGGTLRLS